MNTTLCSKFFKTVLAGGEHAVFFKNEQRVSAEQLKNRALKLSAKLAERQEQRWLIWSDDAGSFLVQLLALCLANKTLIMPGNAQAGTLISLGSHFDAALVDAAILPEALSHYELCTKADDNAPTEVQDLELLAANVECNPKVILFTSGSTGQAKAVEKTLDRLLIEVEAQHQTWGDLVQRNTVLSTVSHQHIYGLLHFVLWPLYRKAPFVAELYQYPEELMAETSLHAPAILVSSPTHLQRLPESEDYLKLHANIRVIYSSTGLLPEETAEALSVINGCSPLEIFGSTETGGVAWRQQGRHDDLWQSLPGVNLSLEPDTGCLIVDSQHSSGTQAQVMGDRAELKYEGAFELKGRTDRIVKVEGKRLSLDEIEAKLCLHPWVAEARITILKRKREEVAAVVVLTNDATQFVAGDKKQVNAKLKQHLSDFYEKVLLPRRWRYRTSLPVDTQGKTTYSLLQACFLSESL